MHFIHSYFKNVSVWDPTTHFNPLVLELDICSLAHHFCKM